MTSFKTTLANIEANTRRIADAGISVTTHYHQEPQALEAIRLDEDLRFRRPDLEHPLARVAVLATAIRTKELLDQAKPDTMGTIKDLEGRYVDLQELLDLLGPTTEDERAQADDLNVRLIG